MDNSIYSKLTESAKTALDESAKEIVDIILDTAYHNATINNTADREISLRDIVEAKEQLLLKRNNFDKLELKKRRLILTASMSGAAYAIFGIAFYLFQNKSLDITKDIGLIIAALGGLISLMSFLYFQLAGKRKVEFIKNNLVIEKDNAEFDIVRKWQIIEKLAATLMEKEGIANNKSKPFNFVLKFLTDKLDDNQKIENLKMILTYRNQIVHGGLNLTKVDIDEVIKKADKIIDQLERETNAKHVKEGGI